MSYDPDGAIEVLQDGLAPGMPHTFVQADGLVSSATSISAKPKTCVYEHVWQLIFELAWTLLSQRRYKEAAEAFIRVTEVNSWCERQLASCAAPLLMFNPGVTEHTTSSLPVVTSP